MAAEEDLYPKVFAKLNSYQQDIVKECISKRKGGLSAPLGSGKTIMGLTLICKWCTPLKPGLVICAKYLLDTWTREIDKWFGKSLKYKVLHGDFCKPTEFETGGVMLILTTPDMIARSFKQNHIEEKFSEIIIINPNAFPMISYKEYKKPNIPFIMEDKGLGIFHSILWGCIIIDEAQTYTKIDTQRCMGIGSLCSDKRWAMSGTIFSEPKVERILGFSIMLDLREMPRNLPSVKRLITNIQFSIMGGINNFLVRRDTCPNSENLNAKLRKHIISFEFSKEEGKLYTTFKSIIFRIRKMVIHLKNIGDVGGARRFGSYLLASITYLRQSIVCPIVPITSAVIDCASFKGKSELSKIIKDEINGLELNDYLSKKSSLVSTRFRKAFEIIHKSNRRIVVFFSFRTCLNVFKSLITDKEVFVIESKHSIKKRGLILEEFSKTKSSILLLTYDLGAEGLNLQCASRMILMDFWWNSAKTNQSIGRILRQGQKAKYIDVYMMTSNTGIEKAIFEKHIAKSEICEELMNGHTTRKVPKLRMKEVIQILEAETVVGLLNKC